MEHFLSITDTAVAKNYEKHCVFFPIPIPQYENKTPCLRAWPATLMMKVKTILISG